MTSGLSAVLCLAATLAGQAATPPVVAESGDEVIVTADRRRCDLSIADRMLSDREFRARARDWAAGRPVRIVVPAGTSYRCQARIVLRLGRYGVHRAVFVNR